MSDRSLYERDVVLWSEQQAGLLRALAAERRHDPIDWENVAEEIESLGRSQVTEVRSRLLRIVEHLLKLQFSPSSDPRRRWIETVATQRAELELLLQDSPSLRGRLADLLDSVRGAGLRPATRSMAAWGEMEATEAALQHGASYTVEQAIGDWFPPWR